MPTRRALVPAPRMRSTKMSGTWRGRGGEEEGRSSHRALVHLVCVCSERGLQLHRRGRGESECSCGHDQALTCCKSSGNITPGPACDRTRVS